MTELLEVIDARIETSAEAYDRTLDKLVQAHEELVEDAMSAERDEHAVTLTRRRALHTALRNAIELLDSDMFDRREIDPLRTLLAEEARA